MLTYDFVLFLCNPESFSSNGDIGGLLGLWVGFSFVTMFEFFQLFVAIICGAGATSDDSKNTQIETGLITQKDTFSTRMMSSKEVEKFDCLTFESKS